MTSQANMKDRLLALLGFILLSMPLAATARQFGDFLRQAKAPVLRRSCCNPVGMLGLSAVLLLTAALSALAGVHYVDMNSTNATPPYTNWATAATDFEEAIDAAFAGDEIVVTNGWYVPASW